MALRRNTHRWYLRFKVLYYNLIANCRALKPSEINRLL